jgi:hypothetical protein
MGGSMAKGIYQKLVRETLRSLPGFPAPGPARHIVGSENKDEKGMKKLRRIAY